MADRTPYLSPEPGEKLQEKQVSGKAYQRLSVAAGAIAETKKAIQHQGNQVPSLQATHMNSLVRLKVMRDELPQPCWEFTNETSARLANENFEALTAAKADLAHGGNCGEHAWVAYHYLRQHAAGEHIQVSQQKGFDHAFVLIGDLKKDTDADIAVSDPWPNKPTACLWEDHFAFCGRDQILDHSSMVADGKSFKSAIAAGLKLTDYGKQVLEQEATQEQTDQMTGPDRKKNHFWNHDDTANPKYDYKPPAQEQQPQGHQEMQHPERH